MMDSLPEGLAKWHTFVSEQDMQALSQALADDVLFRSPVLWKPKEGKATAMLHMSSAVRVLEDFTYHRQFVGDNAVVLEFSFFWDTEGRNLFLISSPSRTPLHSSLPVTVFAFAPENGLLYGELRRAVVERCRNRTLFMASDQKRGSFRQRCTKQNMCSLLLEAQYFLSF